MKLWRFEKVPTLTCSEKSTGIDGISVDDWRQKPILSRTNGRAEKSTGSSATFTEISLTVVPSLTGHMWIPSFQTKPFLVRQKSFPTMIGSFQCRRLSHPKPIVFRQKISFSLPFTLKSIIGGASGAAMAMLMDETLTFRPEPTANSVIVNPAI